ncbi:MAG: YceI family protein [Pseudobdellovibrionaceae bacterium]|jgi:polyisoprenoid-binding protein YceI|nr:YceI family protein [Pseudobdellovibrionaceae bacterium]
MKKTLLATAAAALTLTSATTASFAATETYVLDPYHTNVVWHANHFGFSTPSGKFADVSGKIMLDEAAPQNTSVEVVVKTGSIVTGIEKFNEHLLSKDFFNVTEFPEAKFVSKSVEVTGENTAKINGELTMLGQTHPLILDATLNKIGEHPFSKKKTVGFSAAGTIKRSEYGMTYAVPGVSDEVPLSIEIEASVE